VVDVFEEVEEEIRNDEYNKMLRKWGPLALAAALTVIAMTAGYQVWSSMDASAKQVSADQFMSAQTEYETGNLALAGAGFDTLAATQSAGYETLALLQRAAIALDEGDNEAAGGYFDRAAASVSDPVISDMAKLKAVWSRWEVLSFSDIEIRLNALTDNGAPYRYLARETIAAAALRAGHYDQARRAYQGLTIQTLDYDIPQYVVARANEALAILEQIAPNVSEESVSLPETEANADLEPVDGATSADATVGEDDAESTRVEPVADEAEEPNDE
jgi:hypothetical protein